MPMSTASDVLEGPCLARDRPLPEVWRDIHHEGGCLAAECLLLNRCKTRTRIHDALQQADQQHQEEMSTGRHHPGDTGIGVGGNEHRQAPARGMGVGAWHERVRAGTSNRA
eukprot:365554-Chlamydomonas_euryale.AAC.30